MAQSPVCVLGMHRSGTSMVAELLAECGVFLGEETDLLQAQPDDNPHGYFENTGFVDLDEAILAHFGGSWHELPNLKPGWVSDAAMVPFRERASSLVSQMATKGLWGWKDPRTCLLLPFWDQIVPDARLVLCVRHPEEVAQSFSKRLHANLPRDKALELWRRYNEAALAAIGERPVVVTHYLSYQFDPASELLRVLDALGLPAEAVGRAVEKVDRSLAHGFSSDAALPPEVAEVFAQLCALSGPVYARALGDGSFAARQDDERLEKALTRVQSLEELVQKQVVELGQLRGTVNYLNSRLSPGERTRWRLLEFLRKLKSRLRS